MTERKNCTREGLPIVLEETARSYKSELERNLPDDITNINFADILEIIKSENREFYEFAVREADLMLEKSGESARAGYLVGILQGYGLLVRQCGVNSLDGRKCEE